jgi:phage terminase Nu1 subunit (DNA packaging protein)
MSTISEVCEFCGFSEVTFHALAERGVIKKRPRGKYSIKTVVQAIIKDGIAAKAGHGDHASSVALSMQRAKLAQQHTEMAEMRNAVMRGEFVRLSTVVRVVEEQFVIVRERVLSTPGKSADSLTPYTPKDREAIMTILRDEAYNALTNLSTDAFMMAKMESNRARAKPNGDAAEVERTSA